MVSSQLEPRSEAFPRAVARPDNWFASIERRALSNSACEPPFSLIRSTAASASFSTAGRSCRITERLNDEDAVRLQRKHSRVDGVDDVLFLAKLLIQDRAPAGAQHVAKEFQRRRVRMSKSGNSPGQGETCQFGRELLMRLSASDLLRLACNINRLKGLAGIILKGLFNLLSNLLRIHIARDDKASDCSARNESCNTP